MIVRRVTDVQNPAYRPASPFLFLPVSGYLGAFCFSYCAQIWFRRGIDPIRCVPTAMLGLVHLI